MRLVRRSTAMTAALALAIAGGSAYVASGAPGTTGDGTPKQCKGNNGDKPDCIPPADGTTGNNGNGNGNPNAGPGNNNGNGPGNGNPAAGPGNGNGNGNNPAFVPPGQAKKGGTAPGNSGTAPGRTGDLPEPAMGTRVVVEPSSGTVLVRAPGSSTFVALDPDQPLPVGTTVDATRGRVALTSAISADGTTQTGTFWGGVFTVRQAKGARGMTDLVLTGGLACPGPNATRAKASMALEHGKKRAKRARRATTRRLWGKDSKGRFRTHGRNSVATVRGTQWLTVETCAGTMTFVKHGAVVVRDKRAKKNVLVKAGKRYFASARPSAVRAPRATAPATKRR